MHVIRSVRPWLSRLRWQAVCFLGLTQIKEIEEARVERLKTNRRMELIHLCLMLARRTSWCMGY